MFVIYAVLGCWLQFSSELPNGQSKEGNTISVTKIKIVMAWRLRKVH